MRTAVTETVGSDVTVRQWTCDALNRLTKEVYDSYDDSNDFGHEYEYEIVGNRLHRYVTAGDGNNTAYYYNSNDQLTCEVTDGNTISYEYDKNGALIKKDAGDDPNHYYTYDLRGRLAQVEIENDSTVNYIYNPDGIRVRAIVDGNDIDYLIDPYNHTGYAQIFKEINSATDANTAYIYGHDAIAQATGSNDPKYYLYDGHGTVRHLANSSGSIIESYNYDAYGRAHGFNPADAATALLYCGEMYDQYAQQYYLRARWYSPTTGRFNRMDPFAGSPQDPQSLHKYLYVHNNPVMGIDPSGMNFLALLGQVVHREIELMYQLEHGPGVVTETAIPGASSILIPDIMDFGLKEIAEIKPLSVYGVATGHVQLGGYLLAANSFLGGGWSHSKWDVGIRNVPVPYPDWAVVTLGNAYGVVFYKAVRVPKTAFKVTLTAASLAMMKKMLEESVRQLEQAARYGAGATEGLVYAIETQVEAAVRLAAANRMVSIAVPAITVMVAANLMMRVNLSFATRGLY